MGTLSEGIGKLEVIFDEQVARSETYKNCLRIACESLGRLVDGGRLSDADTQEVGTTVSRIEAILEEWTAKDEDEQ